MRNTENRKRNLRRLLLPAVMAFTALLTAGFLTGCSGKKNLIENVDQLNQKDCIIDVHPGSAAAETAVKRFPNAKIVYSNAISDAYMAVEQGKADAYVYGRLFLQYAVASDALENLAIMDENLDQADIAVGINPSRDDLLLKVNAFIAKIKEDGTLDDMYDRWVVKADKTMPEIPKPTAPVMTLNFGTSGLVEPMNYIDENQELTGFDVEFIYRLAEYLNADINLQAMSFDALVASLESGKLDAVVSDLNVTEERKQVILMSDPYMVSETAVLVQADRLDQSQIFITSVDQVNGKRIGIVAGSSYDIKIKERFPDAELVYTTSYADSIVAMKNGKIDCYITDEPIARYQMAQTPGITYLPELITEDNYAFVLNLDHTELQRELNQALAELKKEGVFDQLKKKWIDGDGTGEPVVEAQTQGAKGTLKVITCGDQEPFTLIRDNEPVGYDIDMLRLAAQKLGYGIELTVADFPALIPSVNSGKADVAVGCITVTEERAKSVLFTDPDYNSGTVIMMLSGEKESGSFMNKLKNSFQRTFITENRWKLVVNGLKVTILLSLASAILGTLLGFVASFPLRSKNPAVRGIAGGISTILDGMPLVVLLMVLYYIIFRTVDISAVWVGVIGFTLDFANTVAGLLNTGVRAVDKGQLEAADSMGYNKREVFCKITFPQAAHQMFAQYEGAVVGLVKGTAIIGYITVEDLTKAGDIIRSRTYEAFFPLIATAVLYFIIASLFIFVLKRVSVGLDPKSRPRMVKGVKIHD